MQIKNLSITKESKYAMLGAARRKSILTDTPSFFRSILTFLDEVEKAEDDAISEISQVCVIFVLITVNYKMLFQVV